MTSRDPKHLSEDVRKIWEKSLAEYVDTYPEDAAPFLTCTHRCNEDQEKLYAKGRTTPGPKVTNARAGQSRHNTNPSTAFDIAFLKSKRVLDWDIKLFNKFAVIAKKNGLRWGGDWKFVDRPHFEK